MKHDEGGGASRSTDPAQGSSTATDVSLREYFEARLSDLALHFESELTQEHNLRIARREDDMRAVDKAEAAMNKRLDSMNELREQLNMQAATFLSQSTAQAELDKLEAVIARNREEITDLRTTLLPREVYEASMAEWTKWRDSVNVYMNVQRGAKQGIGVSVGVVVGGVTMLATILGIVIVLSNVLTSK